MTNDTIPTVTKDQFLTAVFDVLDERGPDYVYPRGYDGTCVYSPDNTHDPSTTEACLFGAAFVKLGITVPLRAEGNGIGSLIQKTPYDGATDPRIVNIPDLDERTAVAMASAQGGQDGGAEYRVVRNRLAGQGVTRP